MKPSRDTQGRSIAQRLVLIKPYRSRLLLSYFLLLLTASFQLFYPKAIAFFIDKSVAGLESTWIFSMAAAMAVVLLVHAMAIALRHYLFASTGSMIVADLRNRFFQAVLRQEVGFFDAENVGDLTNRLSIDVEQLQEALTVDAAMLAQTAITGIGGAIMLVVISPPLSVVMLLLVPLVVLSMRWIGSRSRNLAKMKQDKLAYCGRLAQEVFSNIRLVHAFTQERKETLKFSEATHSALHYGLSGDRLFSGLEGGATFIQSMALLVTVLIGGTLVAGKSLSLGDLTSFILYAGMASGSATTLGALWGEWMRSIGATDRVFELLQRAPRAESAASGKPARLDGEIRFDGVQFSYPERPEHKALDDFSLVIKPGEKIALVGASGAGKSTVVNLLLGYYSPCEGSISLDGTDMRELNLASIRQQIAIVEQEPALFSCSILDNIRYGAIAPDASDEAVLSAARNAHVDEFVSRFPKAYGTLVGARGLQLSGGQKQRVAIARALLRDPRLLILDEATSALDSESENKVQAALRRIMEGRTTIIIAHRLSTVAFADRVFVMRDGKLVQCGTHQELMARQGGYYHQLVSGQMIAAS